MYRSVIILQPQPKSYIPTPNYEIVCDIYKFFYFIAASSFERFSWYPYIVCKYIQTALLYMATYRSCMAILNYLSFIVARTCTPMYGPCRGSYRLFFNLEFSFLHNKFIYETDKLASVL